jgi:hypothetical protein
MSDKKLEARKAEAAKPAQVPTNSKPLQKANDDHRR